MVSIKSIGCKQYQFNRNQYEVLFMRKMLLSLIVIAMLPVAHALDAQSVVGFWYTEDDASIVHITENDGKFFGKIVWIDEPRYVKGDKDEGKLKFDRENREKKLRKRPIVGLPFMNDFTFDSEDVVWKNGTIYDPEKGKVYKCEMRVVPNEEKEGTNKLHVRGYIGIPALGRTTEWFPTPDEDVKKLVPADDEKKKK